MINDEFLWFGGTGGLSTAGALKTWACRNGVWSELTFGDANDRALEQRAQQLVTTARTLYAHVSNRFWRAETTKEAQENLGDEASKLAAAASAFIGSLSPTHAARARATALQSAANTIHQALSQGVAIADVASARKLWQDAIQLGWSVALQPPPRGKTAMVYDAKTQSIVLFGGEGEHGAYNDTWIYQPSSRRWHRVDPNGAPRPRAGHGMLAYDGQVYLVGGFIPRETMSTTGQLWSRLDFDVWRYDVAGNRWTQIRPVASDPIPSSFLSSNMQLTRNGPVLNWHLDNIVYSQKRGEFTGSVEIPGSDVGTAESIVPSNSVHKRGLGFDPAWYETPAVDASSFAAKLAALPANRWVDLKTPRRHVERVWGTVAIDIARDQLLHFAGGHSSHCGTDVAHFSLSQGRWHILHASELPFEFTYSNDGAPYPSFTGWPWGSHSYASYAVDPKSNLMVWAGNHRAYKVTNPSGMFVYDPRSYTWSWPSLIFPFDPERHKTVMAPSQSQLMIWGCKCRRHTSGASGLWTFDAKAASLRAVAGTTTEDKTTYPTSAYGDSHGMAIDTQRNHALMFHFDPRLSYRGKVWVTDIGTGKVTVLTPQGADKIPSYASGARTALYLPNADAVMITSSDFSNTDQITLIYDIKTNAWLELMRPWTTINNKPWPVYGVSTGIQWDPKRKLIWHVNARGHVFVMRFDRTTATLTPL